MVEALSEVVSIESFNHVFEEIFGLLICTLISENQGLEKSGSASNLRKISGPANLDFFFRSPFDKKLNFVPLKK